MDLYRLSQQSDWEEIGLDHYMESQGICLIEWPERLPGIIQLKYRIEITTVNETSRKIRITNP